MRIQEIAKLQTTQIAQIIVNTFSKQVKLTSTESILILPAEETQSHIKEDERERGRVCITSDNAKTNNPCIAITF